ncbi:flavin reductase family protein [Lentzea sp. JNUCC 0626]|uniref:flavin reductase family protein n=1 Tax=Lentzea sp. JNUCC 0626 TaxID=3367513 RepID=UPI00374833F0
MDEFEDPKTLRRVFGTFATGVTVVTVGGPVPHGMTANSFTSVSLDPPLVLVCVGRDASMHRHLTDTGTFGVSVLAADQEDVARHFASRWRPAGQAQFDEVDWVPGTRIDAPLIGGALARFECALWRTYDGGDHTIFLGRLLATDGPAGRTALLFLNGSFHALEHSGLSA